MLIVLIVLLTFNQVYNWSKRHFSDIGQILVLNAYYTLVAFPFGTYLLKDFWKSLIVYTVLFIFTTIVIILIYQVTEDVEQLLNRATFDSLTTLYNSQKFREDLDKFSFTDVSYAMLVVDVDNFKDYNDKYGHLVGDKVIREIGNQLAKMHQEDHTFYRYGGEEFVILIEDCSGEKATRLANEIHQLIGDLRIPIENGEVLEVTVSIGVAHRINKESLLTTFKRADKALYVAKENGKNQIIIH
ncbi:GGDEF domain-containing protein [Aerococcaceae bacterium DSM 111022]|nr:GGDEF domain-containing protein [Aerococcaceae bacterium DSM 111022]